MDRQELALLDVVRLGLTGDTRSLRQRARNLTRGGSTATLSEPARQELQRLLGGVESLEPQRTVPRERPELRTALFDHADEPVLGKELSTRLEQILREHEARHLLEEANLTPTSRVLFTGPPGTGKTMSARWIAARLGKPLMSIEPGQVMSSLMGESAKNLSSLLQAGEASPNVVFLDELDAYARHRGEANDMAEPKRLVNTLLLELDRWPDHSLLIAATNHEDSIDIAVRRRFEVVLPFEHPDRAARRQILLNVLERAGRAPSAELVDAIAAAVGDVSGSTLADTATAALRRSIIDKVDLDLALCQQFFSSRFAGRDSRALAARRAIVRELASRGRSDGEIADLVLSTKQAVAGMLRSDAD
ncbi:MAG TPA: ATP-binding protein [Polyangia bacterium]